MTPHQQADELYWKYTEFEELSIKEVKSCCYIALNKLIQEADTQMKVYWKEVKSIIQQR